MMLSCVRGQQLWVTLYTFPPVNRVAHAQVHELHAVCYTLHVARTSKLWVNLWAEVTLQARRAPQRRFFD